MKSVVSSMKHLSLYLVVAAVFSIIINIWLIVVHVSREPSDADHRLAVHCTVISWQLHYQLRTLREPGEQARVAAQLTYDALRANNWQATLLCAPEFTVSPDDCAPSDVGCMTGATARMWIATTVRL